MLSVISLTLMYLFLIQFVNFKKNICLIIFWLEDMAIQNV